MTQLPDLFAALAAQFHPDEVKTRSQGGRTLSYITARTVMNRLDSVLGPENWWDDYVPGENSVLCRLTIRLPDGSTLTKADAGGYAGMADSGDDDKSGYSDAFKRVAVKFGVGRYLYRDGVPAFVLEHATGVAEDLNPQPQAQTRPAATGTAPSGSKWGNGQGNGNGHQPQPAAGNGQHGGPPRSGKAMFAWTRDMEQKHSVGLLKFLNGWAKLQDFPGRMVDWSPEEVALAYAEATRKLSTLKDTHAAYEEALEN